MRTRNTTERSRHLTIYLLAVVASLFLTQSDPLAAEEVRIEHRNLTLNANLEKAEGDQKRSTAILILHGLLAHNRAEIVRTFQEGYKQNGWTSLAPNLSLGLNDRHGSYDCTVPHRHRLADALDELGVWLAWLKARGTKQVFIVGHSLAANQVLAFTVNHRDPSIAGIVLLAPSTQSHERVVSIFETRYKRKLAPLLDQARKRVAAGKGNALLENTDFMFCPQTTVSAAAFLDFYGENAIRDLPTLLRKNDKPVMVIAASKDDRQPDLIQRVTPFVDNSLVRLEVVDGAGHFFLDLFGEDALKYSVDFIKSLN